MLTSTSILPCPNCAILQIYFWIYSYYEVYFKHTFGDSDFQSFQLYKNNQKIIQKIICGSIFQVYFNSIKNLLIKYIYFKYTTRFFRMEFFGFMSLFTARKEDANQSNYQWISEIETKWKLPYHFEQQSMLIVFLSFYCFFPYCSQLSQIIFKNLIL